MAAAAPKPTASHMAARLAPSICVVSMYNCITLLMSTSEGLQSSPRVDLCSTSCAHGGGGGRVHTGFSTVLEPRAPKSAVRAGGGSLCVHASGASVSALHPGHGEPH